VELLAHVVAREPPREHGRVCAGLHRLHRLVVFSGRRLEHLVAAGLDRGGNLLDDRAALVDDRGDVAGDARRREQRVVARALAVRRVFAHRRDRVGHLSGDVEDRPLCAGRVCLDGGWDRRHRHRETHRVVGGVAIDQDRLCVTSGGRVVSDCGIAVRERHGRVDRRLVGQHGVGDPAADLARAHHEDVHLSSVRKGRAP